ncbi:hypothetical protein F5887DRAFT_898831 [Amanita rubescens]|nr:hypothetical protein F5887DRAFT_899855 [Amanita rubescens]KAF8327328.1 hypothetical protein F5887DRAFT_898831 [Amanita rubescens]
MTKNAQNHSPNIPLREAAPTLKQFRSSVFLTLLIFCPCISPVPTSLVDLGIVLGLPALVRNKARENKYGFNMQPFEAAQVTFYALDEGQGQTTSGSKERLSSCGIIEKVLQVVRCIYSKTRFRNDG